MSSSEKYVTLETFDTKVDGLAAPEARGGLIYSPLWIPPHLRTRAADDLICHNPAVQSSKTDEEFMAGQNERWERIEGIKARIAAGDLRVRTLLGQGVCASHWAEAPLGFR